MSDSCDPMSSSLLGSSVHGILQQEYWSGLPFPSTGYLPDPGIEPGSPAVEADALTSEPPGKIYWNYHWLKKEKLSEAKIWGCRMCTICWCLYVCVCLCVCSPCSFLSCPKLNWIWSLRLSSCFVYTQPILRAPLSHSIPHDTHLLPLLFQELCPVLPKGARGSGEEIQHA